MPAVSNAIHGLTYVWCPGFPDQDPVIGLFVLAIVVALFKGFLCIILRFPKCRGLCTHYWSPFIICILPMMLRTLPYVPEFLDPDSDHMYWVWDGMAVVFILSLLSVFFPAWCSWKNDDANRRRRIEAVQWIALCVFVWLFSRAQHPSRNVSHGAYYLEV